MRSTRPGAILIGATAAALAFGVAVPATSQAATATHATTQHSLSRQAASRQARARRTMAEDLYRLRMCESSGNWRADTGNGYYGAYQFSLATWHGLGFAGRPDRATPTTQSRATTTLHARDGWRPWPACARREHL